MPHWLGSSQRAARLRRSLARKVRRYRRELEPLYNRLEELENIVLDDLDLGQQFRHPDFAQTVRRINKLHRRVRSVLFLVNVTTALVQGRRPEHAVIKLTRAFHLFEDEERYHQVYEGTLSCSDSDIP